MNKMAHEVRGDDGIWRWQWYEGPTFGDRVAGVVKCLAAVTLTAAALVGAGKVAQAGYQKWNEPAMSDEQMSEMTAATIDHIEDQMDHFERNGSKKGPDGMEYGKYEATNRTDNPDGTYQVDSADLSAFVPTSRRGESRIGLQAKYSHLNYDAGGSVANSDDNQSITMTYTFDLQNSGVPVLHRDVDTNKDGVVSPEEALAAVRKYGGTVLAITMERDQNGDGVYEGEPTDDHANLYVNKKKGVGGFCGGSITGHDSGDEGVSHFYITLDTVDGWIREAQPNDK